MKLEENNKFGSPRNFIWVPFENKAHTFFVINVLIQYIALTIASSFLVCTIVDGFANMVENNVKHLNTNIFSVLLLWLAICCVSFALLILYNYKDKKIDKTATSFFLIKNAVYLGMITNIASVFGGMFLLKMKLGNLWVLCFLSNAFIVTFYGLYISTWYEYKYPHMKRFLRVAFIGPYITIFASLFGALILGLFLRYSAVSQSFP